MSFRARGTGKFGNKKTKGYDSGKEYRRAQVLQLWEKAGAITELKFQVVFELVPKQGKEREATYKADFTYIQDGQFVVEDAKGMKTAIYILKRKLMLKVHGIKILET